MVIRAIWPLAVYYPGSVEFTALLTKERNNDVLAAASDGRSKNLLAIDALEYAEISCVKDKTKRMCTRTSIIVPWTPVLYVAIRPDHVSHFRRRLNCRLAFNKKSPLSSMTRRSSVRSLVRCSNRVLWTLESMELYELRFDSYPTRNIASRYLRDNSHARAHQYSLFASDSACFEIALTSYFRRKDRDGGRRRSIEIDDDDDDDDDDEKDEKDRLGIDLRKVFEMGVWCKIEDGDTAASGGGRYIERMTDREIRRNQLPIEPLNVLPVISYDIETIARLDSTLPRGVENDQRLSSIAITVHHPSQEATATTTSVYLAYVPVDDSKGRETAVQRKLREIFSERTTVKFYRRERDLLRDTLSLLSNNDFFAELYRLEDQSDSARLASLLIGYNDWEYDYTFLINRAVYHEMYEEAFHLVQFHDEPRFCFSQLSLDLMKHVRARYAAQLGSFALKHVSGYFGANDRVERDSTERSRREKMAFDAVAIRRMYFTADGGEEIFDSSMAFGDLDADRGVNMLRVSLYNLQDCTAVYYLMENLSLLQSISLYARHFYATLWDSSHAGNSRLLPNAFVVRSLLGRVVLPFRENEHCLLAMPAAPPRDDKDSSSSLIAPCSPAEMTARWQRRELNDGQRRYFDQVSVMRINDKKLYIGGINSAASGHYVRPICLDFVSFYPSIGCQYELSMETVCVVTCDHLLSMYENDESLVDRTIAEGVIRCFDYEPADSPYRRSSNHRTTGELRNGEEDYRGRDALAAAVLRHNGGWYEGVEFTRFREIVATSSDSSRRRVLIVSRTAASLRAAEPPIICSLWKHYLQMRKLYKAQMREATDEFQRRNFSCKEKMVKVVANSLYGYLNYAKSMVYSPPVAAAITLLSRKTFHETAWICQKALPALVSKGGSGDDSSGGEEEIKSVLPTDLVATLATSLSQSSERVRCDIVYRDTDGLILFVSSIDTGSPVNANEHREYERILPLLINGTFSHYGYNDIKIDLEDSEVMTCCIMGKKKYWKHLPNDLFVTKGFEKNAQTFIKHLVRVLQVNVGDIVASRNLAKCRISIENDREFFASMFTALHEYYEKNGPLAFSFNLALNPRTSGGAEANFIQEVIERYNYNPGDRVRCVFALDRSNPEATIFRLLRDFRSLSDRLNYYKVIRRLVTYLVQLTEGFKRHRSNNITAAVGDDDINNDISDDDEIERLAATATSFDRENYTGDGYRSSSSLDNDLRQAYASWLNNEARHRQDSDLYPMDALFRENASDLTDDNRRRRYWSDWTMRNASLLRICSS